MFDLDDPVEIEQWIALNGYLCFASAYGCFEASRLSLLMLGSVVDETMWMGFALWACGHILLHIADYRIPTSIWLWVVRRKRASA